jgi:hypothetical protein
MCQAEAACAATWPDLVVPLGATDSITAHALADVVLAARPTPARRRPFRLSRRAS